MSTDVPVWLVLAKVVRVGSEDIRSHLLIFGSLAVGPGFRWWCLTPGFFFNVFAKTQLRKKNQFLPSAQKLKAIFVQKLKVGAAFT